MKKTHVISLVLLSGLLMELPEAGVWANESEHHEAGGPGMGMGMGDAKSMQKDLGLTDDQVTKLNAAREEQKSTMKLMMEKNHQLMEKLEGQVKNKAADTDLAATLSDLDTTHKNMMEQGEKFRTQKDAILTPTQRAKMMLKHHEMMEHHMMNRKMMKK